MDQVISAENLTKIYPGKVTLYNFSMFIDAGEVVGLLGPNGAGKSTFIRILAGMESSDSGKLLLFGENPSKKNLRLIGVAPQDNAIYVLLTCMENLLYFASLYGISGKKAIEKAEKLLLDLGLSDKKHVQAGFLSGGMKRRLNLACALMHDPRIVILDEPTTGLDPTNRKIMWDMVMKLVRENGVTLLLTTHYMEEAEALCRKVVFINSGQLVAEGSPESLKKMVGKEIAKLTSVPGEYAGLEPLLKKIKGVESVTITKYGIVIESDEISSKVAEITRIFGKHDERIIEFSISKPSLEDVFLKLTGSELKEAVKLGIKK